jgi:hypothetical protein
MTGVQLTLTMALSLALVSSAQPSAKEYRSASDAGIRAHASLPFEGAEPPAHATLALCVTTSCRSRPADPTQFRTYSGRRSAMPGSKTRGSGGPAAANLIGAFHLSLTIPG